MKVEVEALTPKFKPFIVSITISSREEACWLNHLFRCFTIKGCDYTNQVEEFYYRLGSQVKDKCARVGVELPENPSNPGTRTD